MVFNLGQSQVYEAELKNLDYQSPQIYKTIEDSATGVTTFLVKIDKQTLDFYNVNFDRSGGVSFYIPYCELNSTLTLEQFSDSTMVVTRFNDAFLADFEYLFLDFLASQAMISQSIDDFSIGSSEHLMDNVAQRYLGVYRCSFFYDQLKCQMIGMVAFPTDQVLVKVDIYSKTFYMIDYADSNQKVQIYQIDEDQYPQNKVFLPVRTISKSFWNMPNDKMAVYKGT